MSKNLNYIELICTLKPNLQKHKEHLIAFLSDIGYESFMETDKGLNAYILQKDFDAGILKNLQKEFADFKLSTTSKIIENENWNETWTNNYFEPVVFENNLVVRASFHKEFPASKMEIIIDPKTAFGTGYHGTTYMLIEEILQSDMQGKTVLDMGTGTGILAVLSKKKGASRTVAADNDPKAVINAKENCQINNTPDVQVLEGVMSETYGMFDFIYENIWKNIVINDMPMLAKSLNKKGVLLTSGFYFTEFEEVKKAGEAAGLHFVDCKEKDGWAMVKFRKG